MEPIKATLWNGQIQISGKLILTPLKLVFQVADFAESRLSWELPIAEMAKVETCLVFGFARHGLKITDQSGRFDLFVMENVEDFGKQIKNRMQ